MAKQIEARKAARRKVGLLLKNLNSSPLEQPVLLLATHHMPPSSTEQ